MKKGTTLASLAVIILLGLVAYSNSLEGKFIWDDDRLVKDNMYITDFSHLRDIFTKNIRSGAGRKGGIYRPLQTLTYAIDHSFWGLDVRGYHVTNAILHILVALALYWLVAVLYNDRVLSFLAGALFVVHPVHNEAVAYISGRADPLSALFLLLSFVFYVMQQNAPRIHIFFLMLGSYLLALLSRESSLILPVLLLSYHYAFRKKLKVKEFLSLTGVACLYSLVRLTVLQDLLPDIGEHVTTVAERLPGFFVALSRYLRLLILPFDLHMEYGNRLYSMTDPKAMLGIAALCLLLFWAVRRRGDNLVFFSVLWFFTALLPQANIYPPVNAYMAEHWLYLPSVGFFLILAKGTSILLEKRSFKVAGMVLVMVLLAFYSYLTRAQNNYWREPLAFYKRTLEYAPDSSRVYNNLGSIYSDKGEYKEAIPLLEKALRINPRFEEAYGNLGNVYNSLGRTEEAIALYKRAMEINPDLGEKYGYGKLAPMYSSMGKKNEAIALYKKALEMNPDDALVHSNLGKVYTDVGRYDEAIASCKRAIEIDPAYSEAYNNLGVAYSQSGRQGEAIDSFRKAVEIDPRHAKAHFNLAVLYYNNMEYDLSIKHCDRARELGYRVQPELLEFLKPYRRR